jgi:hypothetical protein
MADPQTSQQQDDGTAAAAASMAATQATLAPAGSSLSIPDEVKQQFPELIDLITKSESMNDEERQYWVNILPIMTPDQIQNLKDILTNERSQLAAIDQKYEKEISQVGQEQFLKQVEDERKMRAAQRKAAEEQAKAGESGNAEDVLKQIEGA